MKINFKFITIFLCIIALCNVVNADTQPFICGGGLTVGAGNVLTGSQSTLHFSVTGGALYINKSVLSPTSGISISCVTDGSGILSGYQTGWAKAQIAIFGLLGALCLVAGFICSLTESVKN